MEMIQKEKWSTNAELQNTERKRTRLRTSVGMSECCVESYKSQYAY